MNITITIGEVTRRYTLDEYDIINTNWNEEMEDIVDSISKAKEM